MNTEEKHIPEHIPQELSADGREAGVELEEYKPFPFDPEKISITDKRVPLQTLIRRIEQGSIMSPSIQRGAGLWGDDQQSRLIESLMLRIPVPLFYVAEDNQVRWWIVDGLQRATAIRRYVLNQEFKLSGLEFLSDLDGKKFEELPLKYQNRILETEFQFAIINPSTPQNVQRNVFKRLNTGGLPLTAQEIRHALYYGPSAELLSNLVDSDAFRKATTESVDDSRMAGRELILRFLAFLIRGVDGYPKNEDMDDFLSGTMQIINFMPNLLPEDMQKAFGADFEAIGIRYRTHQQLEERFFLAMKRAILLFKDHAFRKSVSLSGRARTPINKALFEAWSVILSEMKDFEYSELLKRKERLLTLLEVSTYNTPNDDLTRYISRDSHKYQGVLQRYSILTGIIELSLSDTDLEELIKNINKGPNLESAIKDLIEKYIINKDNY